MSSPNREDAPPAKRSVGRRLAIAAPLLLFGALAILFLVKLERGGDPSIVPSVLIGHPAPATELAPLAGLGLPGIRSADFASDGKPTLVNVWASWCAPCRQEHPVLEKLGADPRLRLVGINYKDQPENAVAFLGQLGNPFQAVGVDPTGRTAIDWGVYGVPETYLLGPDGVIRYKFIGPLTDEAVATTLMPEIEKLLPPKS